EPATAGIGSEAPPADARPAVAGIDPEPAVAGAVPAAAGMGAETAVAGVGPASAVGTSTVAGVDAGAAPGSSGPDRGLAASGGVQAASVNGSGGGQAALVNGIAGGQAAPAAVLGPGVVLVPDLPGLGRALQAVAFPTRGRTVVGWDAFFGAARAAEMEREADAALGTLTRAAGTPVANAGDVLDLAAEGKLREVAGTVFPEMPAEETEARIAELITLLLALAALRSDAARWRHSWTGTAELVARDGSHLDLGAIAAKVADPRTVGAARDRLAALGIDPTAAAGDRGAAAARAEVVGGVVNLVVDGSRTDMLIVDTGLLLVPGLPRSQNGSAKRRLARVAATADETPGTRFVAYAEVSDATQTRRTPKAWDLRLRDGGTLSVRAALDSDELPGGWAALDNAVAFLARTR
ncbi:peptidase, partial [Actinoplanes sp. NPDC051633]